MVLFVMLYKVVLTLESMDEILECDYSSEAIGQYFPEVLFFCAVLSGSNIRVSC